MSKLLFTMIACVVIFASCSNSIDDLPEDNGCAERVVIPVSAHSIDAADVPVINNLFSKHSIDNSNFRYFRYRHDTLQTLYPPYARYDQKIVGVDQYVNGVRLFLTGRSFIFLSDNLSFQSPDPTNGTSLNTIPTLNVHQLRKLFLDDIEEFEHKADKYKDSCFKCEFGYYNLNGGTGNAPEVLVKAWRVTPKNTIAPSEYPMAFYKDDNGELIYYDNGIRTFR